MPDVDAPRQPSVLAQQLAALEKRALRGGRRRSQALKEANKDKKITKLTSSTVSDWVKGISPPDDFDRLWALVAVLLEWAGGAPGSETVQYKRWESARQKQQWSAWWDEARKGKGQPEGAAVSARLVRPVRMWTPQQLGVHPAIPGRQMRQPDIEFILPTFVPRPHDDQLRALLAAAAASPEPRMVLVRGTSSTGKTRTAYEALHASVPGNFSLLAPADATSLSEMLHTNSVRPRTVLWLNDAHDHFDGRAGEAAAGALLRRLGGRGPLIVIATLWPEYDDAFTARPPLASDDPHRNARNLLTKIPRIYQPGSFADDLSAVRAAADGDPSLTAVVALGTGEVTQALAAGPDLVKHYEHPAQGDGTYGQALISAAMDAHRLGVTTALPLGFLKTAAPGYLTDTQRADATTDWFEAALAYACTKIKRTSSALQSVPQPEGMGAQPGVLRLADYLQQHGLQTRRWLCPPESFWQGAHQHLQAEGLIQLGRAAHERHRIGWEKRLFGRAAAIGSSNVLIHLAGKLKTEGDSAGAERLYERAADAGSTDAKFQLALMRSERDRAGAERLLHELADVGVTGAMFELARFRALEEDHEGAERFYQRAAADGSALAMHHLGQRQQAAGEHEDAARLFQQAADAGYPGALLDLVYLLEPGDPEGAERAALQSAEAGDTNAWVALAFRWEATGHTEGAERLYRHAARSGHIPRLFELARHQKENGDRERAEWLYQLIADAGESTALLRRAEIREEAEDPEGAERLYQQAAEDGDTHALSYLATMRKAAGDRVRAKQLYQEAANAGDGGALLYLTWMWEEEENPEGLEQAVHEAADRGNTGAMIELAKVRQGTRDLEGAERMYRRAAAAGDTHAMFLLVQMREHEGDRQGAEQAAQEAADAGDTRVLLQLAEIREKAEDNTSAGRLYERVADPGNSGLLFHSITALSRLVRLREKARDREGAERAVRQAANAGIRGLGNGSLEWQDMRSRACGLWPYGLEPDGSPSQPC
ncbi:sel1 repeat family protein [Streptomyces sioyaensis]|uniref:SEL1-like repeat protein n=1 Tax=Streptomyces sioyaensis TaxID=67364 RepID=UPI0036EF56A8